METAVPTIRAGVAGLGMAGNMILHSLARVNGVEITAAADRREHALAAFRHEFGGRAHDSIESLCDDPTVDAVWVATPTHLRRDHVLMLCEAGKHVVIEKPMAATLQDCDDMIAVAAKNRVALIAGGTRSFDPAFVSMRRVISSGRIGKLAALSTWAFTGWMTRPREPHEVDMDRAGGAVYNQAAHSLDVLRMLGGGKLRSVRAATVDIGLPGRPCPGYFVAFLEFTDGTPATLLYDGYGYISSWELVPWGETESRIKAAEAANRYRRALRARSATEVESRELLRFGGQATGARGFGEGAGDGGWTPMDAGLVIALCELGEVRQSSNGLFIYDDDGRHEEPLAEPKSMRELEVEDLRRGLSGERPQHDGAWGKATIEAMLAIMESSARHDDVELKYQVPYFDAQVDI